MIKEDVKQAFELGMIQDEYEIKYPEIEFILRTDTPGYIHARYDIKTNDILIKGIESILGL